MKTYKQIISEVAEPIGDDEKRFKAKHVIQKIGHPVADENQFTAKNTKKDKSKISGYKDGEDETVYEAKMATCEACGEEYNAGGECECGDDEEDDMDDMDEATLTSAENKKKENIVTGMKKSKADLQARYGDKWKSLMYATATKRALQAEAKKAKPGHNAAVMSKNISKVLSAVKKEESEQIDEISRDLARKYIGKVADKKNTGEASPKEVAKRTAGVALAGKKAYDIGGKARVKATEEVDLDEAFKAGSMKLNDGSSVTLTNESSNALNGLFNQLSSTNKTKMEQKLMSGSKGFNEILAFAKEV